MIATQNNKCRRIRSWLHRIIEKRIGFDTPWIRDHVANCPRCQKRLAAIGRVTFALSAIKSNAHSLGLLQRANTQAIGVLKHSLREGPKADLLREALPKPKLLERLGTYKNSVANIAACLIILCLMKVGVFSSMDCVQTQGSKIVKQYYANRAGQDLADEIFIA